jgi:hypothetical protein
MDATKTSFQTVQGQQIEWQANGSAPALKWVDASGNNWRAIASYQFDSNLEVYTTVVSKYLQLGGVGEWLFIEQYYITADGSKYRILATGELIPSIDGIPSALDVNGNIVNPMGWVTNSKYFTIGIGYNPSGAIVSINYWVYLEIAEKEGLIIV